MRPDPFVAVSLALVLERPDDSLRGLNQCGKSDRVFAPDKPIMFQIVILLTRRRAESAGARELGRLGRFGDWRGWCEASTPARVCSTRQIAGADLRSWGRDAV